jgi:uncharacterized protein with HEPN domain
MSRSDVPRLADMLMAAEKIADITARGRPAFDHDVALRRAVERCLEIVGEASKSVSPQLREQYPDVAWADRAKIIDAVGRAARLSGRLWS